MSKQKESGSDNEGDYKSLRDERQEKREEKKTIQRLEADMASMQNNMEQILEMLQRMQLSGNQHTTSSPSVVQPQAQPVDPVSTTPNPPKRESFLSKITPKDLNKSFHLTTHQNLDEKFRKIEAFVRSNDGNDGDLKRILGYACLENDTFTQFFNNNSTKTYPEIKQNFLKQFYVDGVVDRDVAKLFQHKSKDTSWYQFFNTKQLLFDKYCADMSKPNPEFMAAMMYHIVMHSVGMPKDMRDSLVLALSSGYNFETQSKVVPTTFWQKLYAECAHKNKNNSNSTNNDTKPKSKLFCSYCNRQTNHTVDYCRHNPANSTCSKCNFKHKEGVKCMKHSKPTN